MERTEMMKQYEAETGKKAIIALSDTGKNVYRPSYTQWLESQLRWRPVSEKLPSVEKDGDAVIAKLKDADEGLVQFDVVSTVWFVDNYESWYTHWLPIPPVPDTVSDGWEEVKK